MCVGVQQPLAYLLCFRLDCRICIAVLGRINKVLNLVADVPPGIYGRSNTSCVRPRPVQTLKVLQIIHQRGFFMHKGAFVLKINHIPESGTMVFGVVHSPTFPSPHPQFSSRYLGTQFARRVCIQSHCV